MISSDERLANIVGGKSARACDNCVRKRARWYCAADDAFLCQSCDSSVHSANPMVRRHERVRLKTTSMKSFYDKTKLTVDISIPSWQGFTRKARTPRQKKKANPDNHDESIISQFNNPLHFVPEICSNEYSNEENEDQLLYRVPTLDPFSAELCANSAHSNDNNIHFARESKDVCFNQESSHLHGFLPSEMDLAEFAADVENLFGKGLADESFDMEGLGIFDVDDKEWRVKVEDGETGEAAGNNRVDSELMIDIERETFELNFDYESPINREEEAQTKEQTSMMNSEKVFLRLNYEGVVSAWDGNKSPWTTDERPDLNFDECWPDCMGEYETMHVNGEMGMRAAMADGGREARVSRYREKRRTRLFSKKIRYEVRKLNAEKRPRMKGRFVKRTNMVGAFPLLKR